MENNKNILITIKNLSRKVDKGKNAFFANNKINLKIYEGEHVALIGANGAGKTTLVEQIVGLHKPTYGKITYSFGNHKKQISQNIGIQFQDSVYPPNITVKAVIDFVCRAYSADITKEELDNMIDLFLIRPFYTQEAFSLSGGQVQRLNVLLSLIHRPKVLFLDELSTGLDINIRTQIKIFLKDYIRQYGITLVLISHDMNEVEYLCDRIIIMRSGKVIRDVPIKDLKMNNQSLEDAIGKYFNN
jgi:ABC-2 type transport system ATP-binding protein